MQASYFGTSEAQLLGVYSPPSGPVEREQAVLLCHSAPQEYMRSHWALRQLAGRLAASGLHVFRFDYYGTGDSAGASDLGSLEHWRRDIATALEELRDVSGVKRPSLVGFRLGATLAAQVAARVRDLVLWEPVCSGRSYLEELKAAHARYFAHCLHPPALPENGPLGELLGHPLPTALQRELEALTLDAPLACSAERVTLVTREPRAAERQLVETLAASGGSAELVHVSEAEDFLAELLPSARGQERILKLVAERRA